MDRQILILILGTALVTYLPRMLPLVLLSRAQLPEVFLRWLRYIPAAVLAALLAPGLLLPGGKLALGGNPYLLAAIPTGIIAVKTRSMALTILTGMAAMVLIQHWM
ncbi:AzlD domain-containing protein [Moorella naiadis]|uniref:AzlD domain-containing protein n=1 Tax=Moorella naiadis (nom. illeg.) TaxID=3093670 RepID=UPI003D9CB139